MLPRIRIFAIFFVTILVLPGGALAKDTTPEATRVVVGVMDMPPVAMKDDAGQWIGLSMELWRRFELFITFSPEWVVTRANPFPPSSEVKSGLMVSDQRSTKVFIFPDS